MNEPIKIEPAREVGKGLLVILCGMLCVVIGAYGGMAIIEMLMT